MISYLRSGKVWLQVKYRKGKLYQIEDESPQTIYEAFKEIKQI